MTTGKIKFASLGLIFFIFMNPYTHGEKKDVGVIADCNQINPIHEKAVDFLEFDCELLRLQAARLAGEKKYFEAAQCYLALLKFNRNDSTSIYNLACCYGRLRKADLAVKSLVMAVRAGFRDFALLKKDPDFACDPRHSGIHGPADPGACLGGQPRRCASCKNKQVV